MKNSRSLINGLMACGVALAMASTVAAQSVTQVKAKIVRIKGYARITTGNNVWVPVKVGDSLRAGTIIQTSVDKGSFVDLVLGDGDAVASGVIAFVNAEGKATAQEVKAGQQFDPRSNQFTAVQSTVLQLMTQVAHEVGPLGQGGAGLQAIPRDQTVHRVSPVTDENDQG